MASREFLAIETATAEQRVLTSLDIIADAQGIDLDPYPSAEWIEQNLSDGGHITRDKDHTALVRLQWIADVLETLAARAITVIPPRKRAAAAA